MNKPKKHLLFQEDVNQTVESGFLVLQELECVCVSKGLVVLIAQQLKLNIIVLLDESSEGMIVEQLVVVWVLIEGDFLQILKSAEVMSDVINQRLEHGQLALNGRIVVLNCADFIEDFRNLFVETGIVEYDAVGLLSDQRTLYVVDQDGKTEWLLFLLAHWDSPTRPRHSGYRKALEYASGGPWCYSRFQPECRSRRIWWRPKYDTQ